MALPRSEKCAMFTCRRLRHHPFGLLMKSRGKQPKPLMLRPEFTSALSNAAFAKDHNLLPLPQCLDDHGPFLKGCLHHIHARSLGRHFKKSSQAGLLPEGVFRIPTQQRVWPHEF